MKRILAIIGSPRNLGNCELMAKEISRQIPQPHELRLLRLSDFNLKPCSACYACLFSDKGCVIKDDFNQIADEILAADGYIVAAPTYFLGPNSLVKRLTDRGLALYSKAEKMWGRPAVAVSVAGIEGRDGYTQFGLESFLKMLLADIKGSRVVYGALPGEVFFGEENKEIAAQLGQALFGEKQKDEAPACPVCGGTTFRFLGGQKVACMLCSNPGTLSLQGETVVFDVQPGAHELITSKEAAVEHREWLKGMKDRFMAERGKLKQVTKEYLGEGVWVKPL